MKNLTLYIEKRQKLKCHILQHIINEIILFITCDITKKYHKHTLFKYYKNCYYTKYYKVLVYRYILN